MPVTIDFDWDDEALERKLDAIVDNWPGHRAAIRRGIMEDAAGGLRREIPTSSGSAKDTIRLVNIRGQRPAQVVAGGKDGVDYVQPLLDGSKPHAPGSSNPADNPRLVRWARRNNYPGGFEAIYWSIYHYGTEPHDFVTEPVAETQERVADIATQVLRKRGVFD